MLKIKRKFKEVWYNLPLKKILKKNILLESNPDYADNTKFVFDEIIRRKLNKEYKIIWVVNNKKEFRDIKIPNVRFISRHSGKIEKIRYIIKVLFSKYIIDCNEYIHKSNKYQFRIYLTHGQPLKLAIEYIKEAGEFDYMVTTSEYFKKIFEKDFKIEKDKILITGFPRTDAFFKNETPVCVFPSINRKKTIIWMPTYRNHRNWTNNPTFNMNMHYKFGIPCINSEKELYKLNNFLKENKVLLVLKLHPAENISKIKNLELSNIKLFDNSFFKEKHSNIYNVLPLMDALITDYSSVYYDYLFADKPIGLTVSDLEEYSKHVELIENYRNVIKGEYIENFEDLCKFFTNVVNCKDELKESRNEAKKMFHAYIDGQSSARVVDLLEKNMNKEREK